VYEHRIGAIRGFTHTYGVTRLVWYKLHADITEAIAQEKRIKRWRRAWKIALIERNIPMVRPLRNPEPIAAIRGRGLESALIS
jgi:predicted GIY-YIG superfamily endonuclease